MEGTPNDPDPNKPFTKMDNLPLFNEHGKLNPSITIIGKLALLSGLGYFGSKTTEVYSA